MVTGNTTFMYYNMDKGIIKIEVHHLKKKITSHCFVLLVHMQIFTPYFLTSFLPFFHLSAVNLPWNVPWNVPRKRLRKTLQYGTFCF